MVRMAVSLQEADIVMAKMNEIDDITTLSWPTIDEALESGYVEYISSEVDDAYINMLKDLSINGDKVKAQSDMKIIYTPLHGAGN